MTGLPVSVVVVSRERPEALRRTLVGILQLSYPQFEVVVVADRAGLAVVADNPQAAHIKTVEMSQANISGARNRGLAQAAGEIVAFIDDDAVPETGWLQHLVAPFADPDVAAAGGFVRGRNGISWQWQAQSVDNTAHTQPLALEGDQPVVLTPDGVRAIKTEGTNMAFRRDVLAELGGFDPAFHYYLDETDLNLRLALQGHKTALVPLAEVHHGFAENRQRTQARVPRDLTQIGASTAVFLRKHCPETQRASVWQAFCADQRQRLVRHMVQGNLMPGDVRRLMKGLKRGYDEGLQRPIGQMPIIARAPEGLRLLPPQRGPQVLISGRFWRRRKILLQAAEAISEGKRPSVFIFSRTGLFQSMRFDTSGYWVQMGGLFGRSDRTEALFKIRSFRVRLRQEVERISAQRALPDDLVATLSRGSRRRAEKKTRGRV